MKLKHGIDSFIDGQYNGSGNTTADQTADASFLGDAKYYSQPIYGVIMKKDIQDYLKK